MYFCLIKSAWGISYEYLMSTVYKIIDHLYEFFMNLIIIGFI